MLTQLTTFKVYMPPFSMVRL